MTMAVFVLRDFIIVLFLLLVLLLADRFDFQPSLLHKHALSQPEPRATYKHKQVLLLARKFVVPNSMHQTKPRENITVDVCIKSSHGRLNDFLCDITQIHNIHI